MRRGGRCGGEERSGRGQPVVWHESRGMKGGPVAVRLVVWTLCAGTLLADNATLWEGLMDRCRRDGGSYSCVQSTLQGYLERTLDGPQLKLTDYIVFTKNANKYSRQANSDTREARTLDPQRREDTEFSSLIDNLEQKEEDEPRKSVRTISDVLYDRGVGYLMTHDLSLAIPGGGVLKISPRSIEEDGGALVKLTVEDDFSRQETAEKPEGRIFFKKIHESQSIRVGSVLSEYSSIVDAAHVEEETEVGESPKPSVQSSMHLGSDDMFQH
ncbi:hypothetical protein AAG570_009333 [Ranatra chinensis]|uniref:Uncharacterized protein n=1 Tax=Ranatra chinensis TaxID=642074 RepID=A0ABD0YZN8_9HEMI